jgi:hypothetical protein
MWAAGRWRDGGTVTLDDVMTAVERHHAHMAPLVGGLGGATDDVVEQQLIDWLAARWSSNRWSSRLLDPEPARQATQCARRQLDECERAQR